MPHTPIWTTFIDFRVGNIICKFFLLLCMLANTFQFYRTFLKHPVYTAVTQVWPNLKAGFLVIFLVIHTQHLLRNNKIDNEEPHVTAVYFQFFYQAYCHILITFFIVVFPSTNIEIFKCRSTSLILGSQVVFQFLGPNIIVNNWKSNCLIKVRTLKIKLSY